MVSNEIIGISILASVAFVIIIIYLCKCYSDCMRSRHKENVKPASITDQDLILLSVESRNDPIPHDPYCLDNELASKDHDDLEMVAMSIEHFIRKESFRKSLRSNKPKSNQYKHVSKSQRNLIAIENVPGGGTKVDINVENDGGNTGNNNTTTFGPKRKVFEQTIDAPVIVHNALPNFQQATSNNRNVSHIYAAVDKSQTNSSAQFDAPTYFRPVRPVVLNTPPIVPIKPDTPSEPQLDYPETIQQTIKEPSSSDMHKQERHQKERTFPSSMPQKNKKIQPTSENGSLHTPIMPASDHTLIHEIQDEESIIVAKPSKQQKPKKTHPKTSENVPPNEQNVTEQNIFFIPDDMISPKTNRKGRRNSERTIKTLDDIECVREKPRTPKISKKNKKGNTKTDDMGTPKTQKRRNKSSADDDTSKNAKSQSDVPNIKSEVTSPSLNRETVRNTPYSGLCSPPVPPKPRLNPMLSPTLQHNNNNNNNSMHHVQSSQL